MRMIAFLSAAFALAVPASAAPDRASAPTVDVRLSNFSFNPKRIHLRAGQPVVLHLVNAGSGGHNFTAPEFFAAAGVRTGAGVPIRAVELGGRQVRDVAAVPKAGRYPLKCTHSLHKTLGMKGEIVVD
jgi:plastocyanin